MNKIKMILRGHLPNNIIKLKNQLQNSFNILSLSHSLHKFEHNIARVERMQDMSHFLEITPPVLFGFLNLSAEIPSKLCMISIGDFPF
jgi:hypothetical protein